MIIRCDTCNEVTRTADEGDPANVGSMIMRWCSNCGDLTDGVILHYAGACAIRHCPLPVEGEAELTASENQQDFAKVPVKLCNPHIAWVRSVQGADNVPNAEVAMGAIIASIDNERVQLEEIPA